MDALQYAELVQSWARHMLAAEHPDCDGHRESVYDPDDNGGLVTCGCGWAEQIGQPPANRPDAVARVEPALPTAADPVRATLALIDPTQFYGPQDLQDRILDVLARLERGALFERAAIEEAAHTELEFKTAYWQAHARQEGGAADMRKATAMLECEAQHRASIEADFVAKAAKATMHNLRSILSGYQSVARSVLADYQAGGANR